MCRDRRATLSTLIGGLLALLILPDAAVQAAPLRIMTLGDSITQADASHYSYRYEFWKKTLDAGWSVDMVGSGNTNSGGNPAWPTYQGKSFDRDNEGHWGWTVDAALNGSGGQKLATWLTGYTPDIALIHMGTVDACGVGTPAATTANRLGQVIDVIRQDNPNVRIFLAQLIPSRKADYNTAINALNALLPALASGKSLPNSPVTLVNMNTGFNTNWLYDDLHPGTLGEQFLAQKWFDAVQANVPEPSSLSLLAVLGGLLARRRARH